MRACLLVQAAYEVVTTITKYSAGQVAWSHQGLYHFIALLRPICTTFSPRSHFQADLSKFYSFKLHQSYVSGEFIAIAYGLNVHMKNAGSNISLNIISFIKRNDASCCCFCLKL